METIFEFNKDNYQDCQSYYRGPRNQEYYLGDYVIDPGSVVDVRADRKSVGSMSIIRNQSKNRQSFRRSQTHIRQDATDVTVFWFVNRGQLHLTHQSGSKVAGEGGFLVTKSLNAYLLECQTDASQMHDAYQVVVPTHLLGRYIHDDLMTGITMSAESREIALATQILSYLFEAENDDEDESAQSLMTSILSLVQQGLKTGGPINSARQSVADMRLKDIMRFIDVHLSDPNLSISMVAAGCGISERYTSHLLKSKGAPFSSLIWDQRMKVAADMISSSDPSDLFISEIAYRVGFKSTAHFSRMFKRVFKMSPREYRCRLQFADKCMEPA